MGTEEKVVCVTGASGFIASWIVKLLLQRNYTVKASVRNLDDPKKTQHLISLDGAEERLHLFEANLLEEGSFDSLVEGCVAVFHTASPVSFSPSDPQRELIEPAVKGTLNVLRSCTKFASVKRVVLTSSMASVGISRESMALGLADEIDETWFSDPEFCVESKSWYMLSKTLAEEAAWRFAKENGIDLVTTNAAFVIGPLLQPAPSVTVEMILNLINGTQDKYPDEMYGCVDVRDVALAHILAFEVPSAYGRYCLVAHILPYAKLLEILHQLYPSLTIAQNCEGEEPAGPDFGVSKEKAASLGVEFTPLEETLRDTVESLMEKGFLKHI